MTDIIISQNIDLFFRGVLYITSFVLLHLSTTFGNTFQFYMLLNDTPGPTFNIISHE